MAHQTSWYIPRRVVLQRLYGTLTIEELKQINSEFEQCLNEGIPMVHVLVDVSGVERYPIKLHEIAQAMQHGDEREGWVMLIGANPILKFLGSAITQLAKLRFRTFNTVEEAFEFLKQQDYTLSQAPQPRIAN
jgi:hypothetical protein